MASEQNLLERVQKLNEIGILLSKEKDHDKLIEMILFRAKELTNADAGTLYIISPQKKLDFAIVVNDSLDLSWGGAEKAKSKFPAISLYDSQGNPNDRTAVARAVLTKKTVNIKNSYTDTDSGFDFSGTRQFDNQSGYRSESILVVPMLDQDKNQVGALQLINRIDPVTKSVVPFDLADQQLVESLASQAAIALSRQRLIGNLNEMFEGLIEALAEAIDAKSSHTGQHCRRVPEIAMLLADAVNQTTTGPLAKEHFSEEDLYQLKVAAWLHDCGKVTTPVHVVDKATRLEAICDRMEIIQLRFAVLLRDLEISHQRGEMSDEQLLIRKENLLADLAFLQSCNKADALVDPDDVARIYAIGEKTWVDHSGQIHPLLQDQEAQDLQIAQGTLNDDQRETINEHVVATLNMLEKLPWPPHLSEVPEIAGSHHERVDGKGYPRGLKGEEMSLSARLLAIADVFEALTAGDRPYKKAITLDRVVSIMEGMAASGHLDPDLFSVFLRSKVHQVYAKGHDHVKLGKCSE